MYNPYLEKLIDLTPAWYLGYDFEDVGETRVWEHGGSVTGDFNMVHGGTERTEYGPTHDVDARWVYFDGTETNYAMAEEGITGMDDFSISFFLRTDNRDQGSAYLIGAFDLDDHRSWAAQYRGAGHSTFASRHTFFVSTNGTSSTMLQYDPTAWIGANDVWEHIVITRAGSTVTFYRNGGEVGTATASGTLFAATAPFSLATIPDSAGRFQGDIYAPALWTSALSEEDIGDLYDASNIEPPHDLVANDLMTGAVVFDEPTASVEGDLVPLSILTGAVELGTPSLEDIAPIPQNVEISLTSRTSAVITWDDIPEADVFQVEARVRAGRE